MLFPKPAPFASSRLGLLMPELIWLLVVLVFGFARGYAVRARISWRRRAALNGASDTEGTRRAAKAWPRLVEAIV